jgi:hypothetical protein
MPASLKAAIRGFTLTHFGAQIHVGKNWTKVT